MYRTHTCGELRIGNAGQKVTLAGWVQRSRRLGGMTFIDLRDRYGITQLVVEADAEPALVEAATSLGREYVIQVTGEVLERQSKNPKMPTGEIEIKVASINILNKSVTPPFTIEDETDGGEDIRAKYRYLDLRRAPLRRALELRHRVAHEVRNYLDSKGFMEIETPYLIKSTPEGARDFVVPSRMNPGQFYALPQSPQTFKQLLMVAGYDRYFQIVRCFRDEDLRSDKPDIRFDMKLHEVTALVQGHGFGVFDSVPYVGAIAVPGAAEWSRKELDALTEWVKRPQVGAKGLVYVKLGGDGAVKSSVDKFYSPEDLKAVADACGAAAGDLLLILCGEKRKTQTQLGVLRLELGGRLGFRDPKVFAPLWIVDFPLLEWDDETQRFYAMHHPFTAPKPEHLDLFYSDRKEDLEKVCANAYDFVLNGNELGGGSIRIHDAAMQKRMFEVLGIGEEEADYKFGFIINAFKFGAPPHGGLAFGFDRVCALFGGQDSIRDYIAFPKNNQGRDVMIDSPSAIDDAQLDELQIRLDLKQQ